MIGNIDDDVRTYLSATGAVAIYVATVGGDPMRVGFTHDPRKTKVMLARRWPSVQIAWLAWLDKSKAGEFLDLESVNEMRRPLAAVLTEIERQAAAHKVTLTPHTRAVARAKACSARLDATFATLQTSGQLAAFNRAYRIYREGQRRTGESALPYWSARDELRRVVIRYLVMHERFYLPSMLGEIRQRFPWFHVQRPLVSPRAKRPAP